jgi:hypothetical protein
MAFFAASVVSNFLSQRSQLAPIAAKNASMDHFAVIVVTDSLPLLTQHKKEKAPHLWISESSTQRKVIRKGN